MKYLLTAIIIIIWSIGCVLAGRYYFTKTEIEIKEIKVEDTSWKDKYFKLKAQHIEKPEEISIVDFNQFVDCYNSSINFKSYTESNYLHVIAEDNCKRAEARYKIGTKGDWVMYGVIGIAGIATGIIAYSLIK